MSIMTRVPLRLRGVAGIDESGRGPMIGPMVICGLLFDEDPDAVLSGLGVRDSKALTPKRREELYDDILAQTAASCVREVPAASIDELRGRGMSLNEVGLREFITVTKELKPLHLYVDAADVKAERFGRAIGERSRLAHQGMIVVSEHRGDLTYPVVSAASIIAKVHRDRVIKQLHEEYGDFGSGYPVDRKTVMFVEALISKKEPLPSIVRRSWESVKRIEIRLGTKQDTLESY